MITLSPPNNPKLPPHLKILNLVIPEKSLPVSQQHIPSFCGLVATLLGPKLFSLLP